MTQPGASPIPPTPELPPSFARQMLRHTGWVTVSKLAAQGLSMFALLPMYFIMLIRATGISFRDHLGL